MAAHGVGEDSTPTKRSARPIDWFRRDSGVGGTIYVKPAEHSIAPHAATEYPVEDPAAGQFRGDGAESSRR